MRICTVSHCERPSQTLRGGVCQGHYQVRYRGIDPESRVLPPIEIQECFWDDCHSPVKTLKLCGVHYHSARNGLRPFDLVPMNPKCEVDGCETTSSKAKLCSAHYEHKRKGLELKPLVFQKDLICETEDCTEPAQSKGLCRRHYGHSAYQPATKTPCQWPLGCDVANTKSGGDLCSDHRIKQERLDIKKFYQDAWLDIRPLCGVPKCDRGVKSQNWNELCSNHYNDKSRKGLDQAEYIDLMSIDSCEICGDGGFLVVDHIHGHHDDPNRMCKGCIRGRVCNGCNTTLGHSKERPDVLRAAAIYLEAHREGKFSILGEIQ